MTFSVNGATAQLHATFPTDYRYSCYLFSEPFKAWKKIEPKKLVGDAGSF